MLTLDNLKVIKRLGFRENYKKGVRKIQLHRHFQSDISVAKLLKKTKLMLFRSLIDWFLASITNIDTSFRKTVRYCNCIMLREISDVTMATEANVGSNYWKSLIPAGFVCLGLQTLLLEN